MSAFYLLDDRDARQFEPFSLTRPVGELRAGIELVRVRWEGMLGLPCTGHLVAPHLAHFSEPGAPASVSTGMLPAGAIVANARCAPALEEMPLGDLWFCDGRVAAVRLGRELAVDAFRDGSADLTSMAPASPQIVAVRGWWMHHVWDFVRHLSDMIAEDIRCVGPSVRRASPGGAIVVGDHEVVIEAGAHIEPLVVLDATAGPILIRSSATVRAFTHVLGPCYIGRDSQVGAGRIAASSIGDTCRAHGELSTTIFTGHANKSHDGFVGHSILGRWTNLGASTVTSNLKNTYGSVHLWTPAGVQDTGMQLLGSLVGDHAKTAIGTRLTTGSVIGAGANVIADGMAPKVIPPFCWGSAAAGTTYDLDKFIAVAARAMARRQVTLGDTERAHLAAIFDARWFAS